MTGTKKKSNFREKWYSPPPLCEGLYSGVETRVVNGAKSRWFGVERGLRQGCPLSRLIFI